MTARGRTLVLGLVAACLALVMLAHFHLVYVAVQSQPECVAHLEPGTAGEHGTFSAAKSSC